MIKFLKEIIREYNEGTAKDKLSIISSIFTILGLSFVAMLINYIVDPYKINLFAEFIISLAINLVYIFIFIVLSVLIFKLKKIFVKLSQKVGTLIFYMFYIILFLLCLGLLLRYGKDITFILGS